MIMDDVLIICREVDKDSGQIAVYPINEPVDENLAAQLSIRGRLNPELRYFVVLVSDWLQADYKNKLEKLLRRKDVTSRAIDAIDGIMEI